MQKLSLQLRLMVCMMTMRMGDLMGWGLSLEEMLASLFSTLGLLSQLIFQFKLMHIHAEGAGRCTFKQLQLAQSQQFFSFL